MKQKLKENNGFTLIELVIALAVLAFLMTAVSSFMGSSVINYKKTKADVEVHTSAQETYDQMTDSIMQATDVVILGYVQEGSDYKLKYFMKEVRNADNKPDKDLAAKVLAPKIEDFVDEPGVTTAPIVFFSELDKDTKIYIKQLITYNSIQIDPIYISGFDTTKTATYKLDVAPADQVEVSFTEVKDSEGKVIGYDKNDIKKNIFTFDGNKLYYEKKFAYMNMKSSYDECNVGSEPWPKESFLFSDSFESFDTDAGEITNCVATVDYKAGAIGIDFSFNNKNMTYTSLGMINIRNSYVLNLKK